MSRITVTEVGVLSIGKLFGTVNVIIALAIGIIASVVGTVAYLDAGVDGFIEGLFGSLAVILTSVVLFPLVWFAIGWLYGVLVGFIFNVVVGVSGGIQLTTKNEK